ncbi:MAG: InlB B-repeat-containing protein, partial [Bacilli bacterium]|nr:InlB B-repeat-containing protein [Bacilli bacterium]
MKRMFKFLFVIIILFLFGCSNNNENNETNDNKENTTEKCIVSFNSNGGTPIESQEVEKGSQIQLPNDPTKEGHNFLGWYYGDEKWSFISNVVTIDLTLKAKWEKLSYTMSLNVDAKEAGDVIGMNSYLYGDLVTITVTTNAGYTFNGWYDGTTQVSPDETYTFNMPATNLEYTAKWTANTNTTYKVEHYLQNIDNNNYTLYETDNLTGTTDTQTNGSVKTYEGFTSPSITQVNISGNGQTVIVLNYKRNSYAVELSKSIDKAGTITGAGTYKYGKEVTITAVTKEGYTFNGWYKNDE